MAQQDDVQGEQLALHGAGDRLRMAREQAGMTLEQVSAETRIPARHLALIDAGDFNALPARTYAVGFSRSYAKVVGLDSRSIAEQVREELGRERPAERNRAAAFEPGDPARVPSRGLAIASVFAIILLIVGGFMFYRANLAPGAGPPPLVEESDAVVAASTAAPAAPAASATPTGPVVFTALDDEIWVRFSDASGERLYEAILDKGDTYTVPADLEAPTLWTGRPDALGITVGGRPIRKLAEDDRIMKDVPITAAALLQRGTADAGTALPQSVPPAAAANGR